MLPLHHVFETSSRLIPPETPLAQLAFSDVNQFAAEFSDGIYAAPLGGGMTAFSASSQAGENANALLERLVKAARARGLTPVQGTVFCDPALGVHAAFPVACLGRHDTPRGSVLGACITALPRGTFELVRDRDGSACGARRRADGSRYLLLGALVPRDIKATRDVQAAALWNDLKTHFEANDFGLRQLVRTWFYNDRILDWYGNFNRVRNSFFTAHNIFGTFVPASTGIGASNAAGDALTLDALAIAPEKNGIASDANGADRTGGKDDSSGVKIFAVASPLQCPAYDYKSAFSRAAECASPDGSHHLLISGTASIKPGGKTAHLGDVDAQIDLTLRVVAAIPESRGMTWNDTARAILYFPKIEWMPSWEARRVANGLPALPAIFAHTDVCRDDLLFEIELDAWKGDA